MTNTTTPSADPIPGHPATPPRDRRGSRRLFVVVGAAIVVAIVSAATWFWLSSGRDRVFAEAIQGTYDCNDGVTAVGMGEQSSLELVIDASTLVLSGERTVTRDGGTQDTTSWTDRYTWSIDQGVFTLLDADEAYPIVVVEAQVPTTLPDKLTGTARLLGEDVIEFELSVASDGGHFQLDLVSQDDRWTYLVCDRRP